MKELKVKAIGGKVTPRQKTVMIDNTKKMYNFFSSKSLMLMKTGYDTYYISINRKLARKLDIKDSVQIKLFPDAHAIIIGKTLPFPNSRCYDIHNSDTMIVNNPYIGRDIVNELNLDFSKSCAIAFRNISYQEHGDGYFATVFLK